MLVLWCAKILWRGGTILESRQRRNKICYVVTIPTTIRAFFIPQLKYLAEHGYDITVVCGQDDKLQQDLGDNICYTPVDMPRGLSLFGSMKAIKLLYNVMKSNRFDLVQYSTPNAALYASIASKLAGVKVRNYHLMGFRYLGASGIGKKILKGIEQISCKLSTSIECVSESNLRLGIQEGIFEEKKATVVWHGSTGGVDLRRFDYAKRYIWRNEVRSQLGLADDDFVFGFVGRITKDKGVNEILEAFLGSQVGTKLLLVGAEEGLDTLDQWLLQKAKSHPDVIFQGPVRDVERYLSAIDVLLLPSYREGFGNVVIEAAAVGTPAIISNIPGPIDAVEPGKTALVVSAKSVSELEMAMECTRGDKVHGMKENCVEFVRTHFDSEKLCKKILERKSKLIN
ncbi:glycosyltransferase family 4 protein [Pseudoflavonifractor sp. An44]|uniref:glycosyltransferase family 4 protein n=1 Tax=Pseudoflavonifractor sp. An44 TaxID=1965635 RepID=UPI0031B9F0B3